MTAVAMRERRLARAPRPVRRQPSHAEVLCLRMLRAGLAVGHVGLVASMGIGLLGWHGLGVANAAVAGGMVMAFIVSGQGVQVLAAEMSGGVGLVVILVSYLVRVGAMGALLWLAMSQQGRLEAVFVRPAFFLAAVLTLVGWLFGVVWTGARQQVFTHDSEFLANRDAASAAARGDLGDNRGDPL